jgi:hypothetical protein
LRKSRSIYGEDTCAHAKVSESGYNEKATAIVQSKWDLF